MDWTATYETDFGLDIPLARLPVYFVVDDEKFESDESEDWEYFPNLIQSVYRRSSLNCSLFLPFKQVRYYRLWYTDIAYHRVPVIWRAGPDYDLLQQQLANDSRAMRIDYFAEQIDDECKDFYNSLFET